MTTPCTTTCVFVEVYLLLVDCFYVGYAFPGGANVYIYVCLWPMVYRLCIDKWDMWSGGVFGRSILVVYLL